MAGKYKSPTPADTKRNDATATEAANKAIAADAENKRQQEITRQVKEGEKLRFKIKAEMDSYGVSKAIIRGSMDYIIKTYTPPYPLDIAENFLKLQKKSYVIETDLIALKYKLDGTNAKIKELLASRKAGYKWENTLRGMNYPNTNKYEKPPAPPKGNYEGLVYQYNIPMLKAAYLNPFGVQSRSVSDPSSLSAPTYTNGRQAFKGLTTQDYVGGEQQWQGVVPSRGTIQMSKMFAENAITTDAEKELAKKSGLKFNDTPYGFRFLYNPTDVSMAWGIVDAFSPQYAASGANGMTGVAAGLMKGTIAFTLLLNRIEDMGVIYPDGSYLQDVYPKDPPLTETKMIYNKGTMYDIEYLFRAMNGFYADYESGLNGTTADKGWLQPIPMELHLGAGLRYLVRVSSLDLKHMMFNERMVPILTTVNIVCTRYYDTLTGKNQDGEFDRSVYNPESPGSTALG